MSGAYPASVVQATSLPPSPTFSLLAKPLYFGRVLMQPICPRAFVKAWGTVQLNCLVMGLPLVQTLHLMHDGQAPPLINDRSCALVLTDKTSAYIWVSINLRLTCSSRLHVARPESCQPSTQGLQSL